MAAHWVGDVDIAVAAITDWLGRAALFVPSVAIDCDSGVAPCPACVGGKGWGLKEGVPFRLAPIRLSHHSARVTTPL